MRWLFCFREVHQNKSRWTSIVVRMIESMRVLERAVRPSVTCVHAYMYSNGEYECLSEVSERAGSTCGGVT